MKPVILIFTCIIVTMFGNSCSRNTDTPGGFVGKWTLAEVYANDYWGGPLYWREAKGDVRIQFTNDGKYYRKYAKDSFYTLIGNYQKLSDSTIKITWAQPPNPDAPSYILNYTFSKGRYMTWGWFGFEGIAEEKFRLD
ncbi:MAG TPA: hypothetical protein VIM79_08655 [Niastella sp.]